jgi:hypothetical protein
MDLPCETCLVLARCKQRVCPNPPRFIPSMKIIDALLTTDLESSVKCPALREYCKFKSDGENAWRNIYTVTKFFGTPYGEPYL